MSATVVLPPVVAPSHQDSISLNETIPNQESPQARGTLILSQPSEPTDAVSEPACNPAPPESSATPPEPVPESEKPAPEYVHTDPLPFKQRLKSTALQITSLPLSLTFLSLIATAAFLSHIPKTLFRPTRRKSVSVAATSNPVVPLDGFTPTESGPDKLVREVKYYAERVGLTCRELKVTTEDGFIIDLWHIFDPSTPPVSTTLPNQKYPVLLLHGLLQSSGAFCVNDDSSLAFDLCKSGYDVYLGNNRCGFTPQHVSYKTSDPRMWSWDIREMATQDLPALVNRVLKETGHKKLALVAHSQGTAQSLLALSTTFNPSLSQKLSVLCLLAPAAYAGPLIRKPWFRLLSALPSPLWSVTFGSRAFIPAMMSAHRFMNPRIFGDLGYVVFSFLFGWSDRNWDPSLRARMFQFAPVYVSAGLMKWWLGKGGFAHMGSILENVAEDDPEVTPEEAERGRWYPEGTAPMGLWVCERDGLVDGGRLLKRLREREPNVKIVHGEVLADYEHLDVLWAVDAAERVNKSIKSVIWETVEPEMKAHCQGPPTMQNTQV